jgi:hypothetical protein
LDCELLLSGCPTATLLVSRQEIAVMEEILREPVELTETELDAVAGGAGAAAAGAGSHAAIAVASTGGIEFDGLLIFPNAAAAAAF